MNKNLILGTLLLALVLATGTSAEMIVGDATGDVLTILNTETGELTDFLPITTPHIVSLAYSDATGELYCSDTSEGVNQVLSIDLETGATSLVVQVPDFWTILHCMAVDPASGELYAIDQEQAILYRVNIPDGTLEFVGFTGVNWITGADFDPVSGQLYICIGGLDDSGALYTVNTTTGAATFVANTHRLMGLGFDNNGDLYGVNNYWYPDPPGAYQINKVTGDWTFLGADLTGRNPMSIDYVELPSPTQTLQVTVTGEVEWNQVSFGIFADVNAGDPVTMTFEVNSEDYFNSPTYPTRGYVIDQDSYVLNVGSATVSLANPYPDGQVPYFVLRNNDPAADGFFIASNNVDYPYPGLPLNEPGVIGEPFESHYDVGYTEDTLSSLDILDAVGIYDYTGLTRFYFNIVDLGMEPIGLIFTQMEIGVAGPFDVSIDCLTPTMALPDMGGFQVDLTNNSDTMINLAAQVDVTLCNGVTITNIRSGNTMLSVDETYSTSWTQPIPALATTCGCDLLWTLTGQDTTTLVEDMNSCTMTTTCE